MDRWDQDRPITTAKPEASKTATPVVKIVAAIRAHRDNAAKAGAAAGSQPDAAKG